MALLALQILLRRLLVAAPIVLCVSALVFGVLRLLPADPVSMSLPPAPPSRVNTSAASR